LCNNYIIKRAVIEEGDPLDDGEKDGMLLLKKL